MDNKALRPGDSAGAPRLSPAQAQVIDRLEPECHHEMVAIATSLIRQYRIDPAGLAPEGAVNGAMLKVCQAIAAGTFREISSRDELMKAYHHMVRRFLQDWRRRERSLKHGGHATAQAGQSASESIEAELDAIPSDAAQPGAPVDAADEVERMMNLLDPHDRSPGDPRARSLREIATLASSGMTHEEIAARLGRSVPTVERRLRLIRSIWGEYDPNPRRGENPKGTDRRS